MSGDFYMIPAGSMPGKMVYISYRLILQKICDPIIAIGSVAAKIPVNMQVARVKFLSQTRFLSFKTGIRFDNKSACLYNQSGVNMGKICLNFNIVRQKRCLAQFKLPLRKKNAKSYSHGG